MKFFQLGLTLSVALLLSSVVQGQGGRPGGQGGTSAVSLLNIKAVQEELKVSEDQLKSLPEAMAKALGEVLNKDQMKRLRQIELQQKGINAYKDAKVQETLKLTAQQKETITELMTDLEKETKELFKGGKGGFAEGFKKVAALRKESKEKIEGLLKADQKETWKGMIGEEFKMPAFGRPGAGAGATDATPQIQRQRVPNAQPQIQPKKRDA